MLDSISFSLLAKAQEEQSPLPTTPPPNHSPFHQFLSQPFPLQALFLFQTPSISQPPPQTGTCLQGGLPNRLDKLKLDYIKTMTIPSALPGSLTPQPRHLASLDPITISKDWSFKAPIWIPHHHSPEYQSPRQKLTIKIHPKETSSMSDIKNCLPDSPAILFLYQHVWKPH